MPWKAGRLKAGRIGKRRIGKTDLPKIRGQSWKSVFLFLWPLPQRINKPYGKFIANLKVIKVMKIEKF